MLSLLTCFHRDVSAVVCNACACVCVCVYTHFKHSSWKEFVTILKGNIMLNHIFLWQQTELCILLYFLSFWVLLLLKKAVNNVWCILRHIWYGCLEQNFVKSVKSCHVKMSIKFVYGLLLVPFQYCWSVAYWGEGVWGVQLVIDDRWNKVLFWAISEDTRDKAKFFDYCKIHTDSFKEMYVPINSRSQIICTLQSILCG